MKEIICKTHTYTRNQQNKHTKKSNKKNVNDSNEFHCESKNEDEEKKM